MKRVLREAHEEKPSKKYKSEKEESKEVKREEEEEEGKEEKREEEEEGKEGKEEKGEEEEEEGKEEKGEEEEEEGEEEEEIEIVYPGEYIFPDFEEKATPLESQSDLLAHNMFIYNLTEIPAKERKISSLILKPYYSNLGIEGEPETELEGMDISRFKSLFSPIPDAEQKYKQVRIKKEFVSGSKRRGFSRDAELEGWKELNEKCNYRHHVIPMLGAWRDEQHNYFSMPSCGVTLQDVYADKYEMPSEKFEIMVRAMIPQIAEALACIHNAGLQHGAVIMRAIIFCGNGGGWTLEPSPTIRPEGQVNRFAGSDIDMFAHIVNWVTPYLGVDRETQIYLGELTKNLKKPGTSDAKKFAAFAEATKFLLPL